jgi:hypothetical protein
MRVIKNNKYEGVMRYDAIRRDRNFMSEGSYGVFVMLARWIEVANKMAVMTNARPGTGSRI